MASFLSWCQGQWLVLEPSPIEAGLLFILTWLLIIISGIAVSIVLSEEVGGYEIK